MRLKKKFNISTLVFASLFCVLFAYMISVLLLLFWVLMTAFKSNDAFIQSSYKLPTELYWENFKTVFEEFKVPVTLSNGSTAKALMSTMVINSVIYSAGSAFFAAITPCITAYAITRFKFKFNKIIYGIVIVTMILPIVGSLPSEIQMAKNVGFYDNLLGVCLMKANFLGMYFLIFHATFKSVSKAYIEAAMIDGANEFVIFTKIAMPMVRNTILVVFLLKFIEFWNDYQTPMMFIPNHPTVAYGLLQFNASASQTLAFIPIKMTACAVLMVPIVIIFIIFRDKIMGSVSIGGLKG